MNRHARMCGVVLLALLLLAPMMGALADAPSIYLPVVGFNVRWSPTNNPPHTPSSPSPADGAKDLSVLIDLLWSGGDPDGDMVTYSVYLGAGDRPPDRLICEGIRSAKCPTGRLESDTHYNWKVVSSDARLASVESPVWDFHTGLGVRQTEMVDIPAGEFRMGCSHYNIYDKFCYDDATPPHPVYLDAYSMDKTEVTTGQYAQCVAEGACAAPAGFHSTTRTAYFGNPLYADFPVIQVSWDRARDYCAWKGKRLPTEAEWEKAARGDGQDLLTFPWGYEQVSCSRANIRYCVGDTVKVGSYPTGASLYGVLDMAGNVGEWVADWYDPYYYWISPYDNPKGPGTADHRVMRGGGWYSDPDEVEVTYREYWHPGGTSTGIGFRCAASASG